MMFHKDSNTSNADLLDGLKNVVNQIVVNILRTGNKFDNE